MLLIFFFHVVLSLKSGATKELGKPFWLPLMSKSCSYDKSGQNSGTRKLYPTAGVS